MSVVAFRMKPAPAGCGICGGADLWPLRHETEEHTLIECADCGVWSVAPAPAPWTLRARYRDAYHAPWRREPLHRRRMNARRTRFLRTARRGRLLDVGCGDGRFLEQAMRQGFVVEGTELCRSAAKRTARRLGIPVFSGDLVEADYPDGIFSVVTLWHVLDRLIEPGEVLAEARRILEPGGLLAVAVPNRTSSLFNTAHRALRRQPRQLYEPDARHPRLHHWNPASLCWTLEAHGFGEIALFPDPVAGSWARALDRLAALHSLLAGEPRTRGMVALCRAAQDDRR